MPTHVTVTHRPAYRDANVLRWLGAYTTSVTGDVVFYMALTWAAARSVGPAETGLVLAAGAVPRAVLMLGGGVIADRFGLRRVLIGSDLVRCAAVLAIATLTFAIGSGLPTLLTLALIFGAVDAIFMPAVGALPPRLTDASQFARVQGMRILSVRVGNTIGPIIAAAALTAAGSGGGFTAAGLLFIASLVLLITVRVAPPPFSDPAQAGEVSTAWADLRDGLRHLRSNRRLKRLVIVIGLAEMCFSGPVAAGMILLVNERDWSAAVLGGILAAFSIGGAVAGLALTAAGRLPRPASIMAVALLLTAMLVTTVGLADAPIVTIAVTAGLGVTTGVGMALSHALLQEQTAPHYLGRITSVTSLCTFGLSPLLYPMVGFVAAMWGVGVFFAACGIVCAVAATVSFSPALRAIR